MPAFGHHQDIPKIKHAWEKGPEQSAMTMSQ